MVISNIKFLKDDATVTLSADITFRGKKTERAYITTDVIHEDFIETDASPFLAAVLLPCMKTGENIYVDGSVSEMLLSNTSDIMRLVIKWDVGLRKIKIRTKNVHPDDNKPRFTGTFFTAGVDSFYTYLKHKNQIRNRITHLILVHGFDIPLQNESFFEEVKTTVEKVASEEKVAAIFLKTNVGEIIERRLVWDFAHGGALAAMALFLRKNLKTIMISSAVRNDQLFPYGTHPDLDKLWSTENQTVKSDGGEYDRVGKIITLISSSTLALKYLRVCTQNLKGQYNCSHCFKCLMTMMYLAGTNALSRSKTFEKKIDLEAVRNMYYDYKLKYNIQGEMALAMLKQQNREPELQRAIEESLEKSKKPKLIKRVTQQIAKFDQTYNDRRLYQMVFRMNNQEDRNFVFKFLFKRGILK